LWHVPSVSHPTAFGVKTLGMLVSALFIVLNFSWCCIISLACKLFLSSSLCVQLCLLLYVCFIICTFLSMQTIFLRIFHPPPPKNNGPSLISWQYCSSVGSFFSFFSCFERPTLYCAAQFVLSKASVLTVISVYDCKWILTHACCMHTCTFLLSIFPIGLYNAHYMQFELIMYNMSTTAWRLFMFMEDILAHIEEQYSVENLVKRTVENCCLLY
jgi:hypothetical protein